MNADAGAEAPAPHVDPKRRNWVWRISQLVMQNVFLFWLNYRLAGRDRLPDGPALLLINHQSSLDPLAVGVALDRPVSYLARHELFEIPVIGWILKHTYVMPIRRDSAGGESIRQSVARLEQGYYVGLFPEGTRSADGELQPLKPGFVAIARRARAPVIPVAVAGAHEAYPRGSMLPWRGCVRVVVGEPFSPEEVAELTARGREREFVGLVEQRLRDAFEIAREWRLGRVLPRDVRRPSGRPERSKAPAPSPDSLS